MKKILLFGLLVVFAGNYSYAQSLERQVIGSAGVYSLATWGSISTTVGEPVVKTATASSLVLTQGFQQPLQSDLAVYNVPANNISVKVFPVPASDVLNVEISGSGHYAVAIFDVPGRRLELPYQDRSSTGQAMFTYDIHSLAAGAYLVLISDDHGQNVKTIKFTKLN